MPLKQIGSHLTILVLVTFLLIISCGEQTRKIELDKSMIGKQAVCPVTGDEFTIHDQTPVVRYREGVYYMCCPGCDTEFMKDPEKYTINMEQKDESVETEMPGDSEILHWTCTMHPEVKSDEDGNCPICGMNLTPVYEREESDNSLNLSEGEIELAGIRMVPATFKHLLRQIRVVGSVAYDPGLLVAQEEYVNALVMREMIRDDDLARARAEQLIMNAEYKLELLGMSRAEIASLERVRIPQRSLVLPDGHTWIYANAYESDLHGVKSGQQAVITSSVLPGSKFKGRVMSVNPIIDVQTRASVVRIRLDHAEPGLRPGMYVEARILVQIDQPGKKAGGMVLAVPRDAVLDLGTRKIVWVHAGNGKFQPRIVKVGPRATAHDEEVGAAYYPVLEGLSENEMVVSRGNFLIDSESSLSGVAAIGYGGALGVEERDGPSTGHQH
jgi:Cu(I)/Ag(I) efflux system membrane fusion protein